MSYILNCAFGTVSLFSNLKKNRFKLMVFTLKKKLAAGGSRNVKHFKKIMMYF